MTKQSDMLEKLDTLNALQERYFTIEVILDKINSLNFSTAKKFKLTYLEKDDIRKGDDNCYRLKMGITDDFKPYLEEALKAYADDLQKEKTQLKKEIESKVN